LVISVAMLRIKAVQWLEYKGIGLNGRKKKRVRK
jgi:hypothetical protein